MPFLAAAGRSRRAMPPSPGRMHARARRFAALLGLACCGWAVLPVPAAQARTPDANQIYIPGPGEHNAARAAATAEAGSAQTPASTGMITIPGPGEHAAASNAVMPVIVTSPPPMTRPAQPIAVEHPVPIAAKQPALVAAAEPHYTAAEPVQPTAPAAPAPAIAASSEPQPAAPTGKEDGESIRRVALAFLKEQAIGLPGKVTVTVSPAFPRGLAACTTLVPFMPPGARLWGSTSVGVRCAGAHPWTLYMRARISMMSTYYLAARQIEPNTVVTPADLTTREGDLANLPRSIVTDASQVVGAVALSRIGAGMPLRQDMLRSVSAVTIGQTVRIIAVGHGFTISSEGRVMNNAEPGEQVRIKTANGQIISGVVKDGSTVEIPM